MSTSPVQTIEEADVYLGTWTNWSYGFVMGATLTMTSQGGNFLIAFIALYVSVAGSCFWNICRFLLHHHLSRQALQNTIYHQVQVVLRNADTSTSGLLKVLTILWTWRRYKDSKPKRKVLPLIGLNVLLIAIFAAASILSARVATSNGGEVLLKGTGCGIFYGVGDGNLTDSVLLVGYQVQRTMFSFGYVQQCYGDNSFSQDCPTYAQPNLPYTVTTNASCPFPGQASICRNESQAIMIDSGFIHSLLDLGINAPPEKQFLYRIVAQCSPILNEGFTANQSEPANSNGDTHINVNFLYGPSGQYGTPTYQYSAEPPLTNYSQYGNRAYSLFSQNSYGLLNGSFVPEYFTPIPELQSSEGDITLIFLSSNDVIYYNPVNDPWYSAHEVVHVSPQESDYFRDDPARTLGCVSKYQFCNPNLPKASSCTPLAGIYAVSDPFLALWETEEDQIYINWTYSGILNMAAGVSDIPGNLGTTSLLAVNTLFEGIQLGLARNQWELEVENWFATSMADLQRTVVEQATGPADPSFARFFQPPNSTEEKSACANQKIRSDSFTSFNILGLILIFTIGGLIMITSYALPFIFERWLRKNSYEVLEWKTNDSLQLQRLAHEAIGSGTWQGGANACPTTDPEELPAILDITEPGHPKLKINAEGSVILQDQVRDKKRA